ncbi:formate dehydrogenase accessory sulfurtransferase FdhD [Geminicoccus roseus]|uniref:formate dehydrogenase accessory sulfurtransferase FdhD n=1 Tax=Geminicoccus roseus TaxID=404900 RepID=UPI0005564A13|nr:formate dehydrogenase accessory sulfurtransferase FdhD [Geminicoccus roseus]
MEPTARRRRRGHPVAPSRAVRRYQDGRFVERIETIAGECATALVYNGDSFAVMMTTPEHLEDFAVGFTLAEGIVADAQEISAITVEDVVLGVEIRLTIPARRMDALLDRRRNVTAGTSCGMCGILSIERALRALPALPPSPSIPGSVVQQALAALPEHQAVNHQTGAAHAAAFADRDGRVVLLREDVGRHNALDKLTGAMARAGLLAADGFLLLTSRCSTEMVQKAALAGFPVVVAISAPTTLAVELADAAGLTLIGFARPSGFNVYTHEQRITL